MGVFYVYICVYVLQQCSKCRRCFAVTLERTFRSDSYISAWQYGQMSTSVHCAESANYLSLNWNNSTLGTEQSPTSGWQAGLHFLSINHGHFMTKYVMFLWRYICRAQLITNYITGIMLSKSCITVLADNITILLYRTPLFIYTVIVLPYLHITYINKGILGWL